MFRRNDTRRVQILGTNAIAAIQIIARRLEDAQAHQYDAFQRHNSGGTRRSRSGRGRSIRSGLATRPKRRRFS